MALEVEDGIVRRLAAASQESLAHDSALQAVDRVPLKLVAHAAWEAARDVIFKARGATKELLRMTMHATAEARRGKIGLSLWWIPFHMTYIV
ncbi:MAG: hypothetical protein U0984_19175, partial [Prosthecobacter sp.]|nr:hypothetical protein [Prosthecobacter sp.]